MWDGNHKAIDSSLDICAFLMQKTRLGTLNNTFINSLYWSDVTKPKDWCSFSFHPKFNRLSLWIWMERI